MVIILGHDDLDGIVSAALLEHSFPGSELYFLSYLNPKQWIQTLEETKQKESTSLFIVDLGVNSFFSRNGILKLLQENSQKHYLTWYDHHHWDSPQSDLALSLGSLVDPQSSSTARIIVEKKGITDPFFLLLARYADLSDNMVTAPPAEQNDAQVAQVKQYEDYAQDEDYALVTRLDDLLSSSYDKKKVVRLFAHERKVWLPEFDQAREKYLVRKKEAEELLQSHAFYHQTPFPLVVGLSPPLLFSQAARLSLEENFPRTQLKVIFFESTHSVTVYSPVHDVSRLAHSLGGCGHSYAAGFPVEEKITQRNFPRLQRQLLSRIKDCYIEQH